MTVILNKEQKKLIACRAKEIAKENSNRRNDLVPMKVSFPSEDLRSKDDNRDCATMQIEKKDNWNEPYGCRSCRWYYAKHDVVGRCRRRAPTLSGFPVVYASDCCGEHKLR